MQIDNLEGTDIKLEIVEMGQFSQDQIAFWKRQKETVNLRDHLMKFLLTEDNSNGWEPWEEVDFGEEWTQLLAELEENERKSQNEFLEDIKEIAEVSMLSIALNSIGKADINLNYQFKEKYIYEGDWRLKAGRHLLDGQTLLHAACWHIKPKFVLSLLRHGADPNKQVSENYSKTLLKWNNPIGYTPLNVMLSRVISTTTTFDEQRIKDFKNIIEYLLDFGADPNIGSTLCVKKTLYTALGFIRHETFQNKFGKKESESLRKKLIGKGALMTAIQPETRWILDFNSRLAIDKKKIMLNKTTLGFEVEEHILLKVKERITNQIKQLLNKFDWPSKVTNQTECIFCFGEFPLVELHGNNPPEKKVKQIRESNDEKETRKEEEDLKERNKNIIKLKCGHVFHYTCLHKWWESFEDKTKFTCPKCRFLAGDPKSWKHAHMFPYYEKMYPNNNKIIEFEGWALSNKMKLKF